MPDTHDRKVGCEDADGLLHVHPETEVCQVCSATLAVPPSQWQPIETLAPEPGQIKVRCLVAEEDFVFEAIYDVEQGAFYEPNAEHGDEYERLVHPTHWMPLPLPPVSQEPER